MPPSRSPANDMFVTLFARPATGHKVAAITNVRLSHLVAFNQPLPSVHPGASTPALVTIAPSRLVTQRFIMHQRPFVSSPHCVDRCTIAGTSQSISRTLATGSALLRWPTSNLLVQQATADQSVSPCGLAHLQNGPRRRCGQSISVR